MCITIYHNPACSKSTKTLAILNDRNLKVEIIEYLRHPPTISQLKHILKLLNTEIDSIIRKNEPLYSSLGLDNPSLDSKTKLNLIINNPKLLQRPIVIRNSQAVIARPPEKVLEML